MHYREFLESWLFLSLQSKYLSIMNKYKIQKDGGNSYIAVVKKTTDWLADSKLTELLFALTALFS